MLSQSWPAAVVEEDATLVAKDQEAWNTSLAVLLRQQRLLGNPRCSKGSLVFVNQIEKGTSCSRDKERVCEIDFSANRSQKVAGDQLLALRSTKKGDGNVSDETSAVNTRSSSCDNNCARSDCVCLACFGFGGCSIFSLSRASSLLLRPRSASSISQQSRA